MCLILAVAERHRVKSEAAPWPPLVDQALGVGIDRIERARVRVMAGGDLGEKERACGSGERMRGGESEPVTWAQV